VVGVASSGHAALTQTELLRPDVVLLDIQLPDLDGFEVAERLNSGAHRPRIVLISSRPSRTYGARLAQASVRGFMNKGELSGAALAALVG
jgi:two-component system response regulator EvgA